ncbi:MAG: ribonuclease D, partial [Mycobacteriales bacterium]
ASRDPAAAERLTASRRAVGAIAAERGLPVENLLAPDAVRRLAWEPPAPVDLASVTRFLIGRQARPWQVALTAEALTGALTARAPAPVGSPPDTNTSE